MAIFDIDGTIFRSSLLIELTEGLVQEGVLPERVKRVYAAAYQRWLDREGSYEDYIGAVIKAFESHIKGISSEEFERVAAQVVSFHKNRVYRYTRDLVKDLKRRGYFLLAISNSPKAVLDVFCSQLGFTKIYGRIYEVDDGGHLSGKTAYLELVQDKAKILQRAVERNDLTLRGSIGVGDTESDIPFLKMVDRPICFNPNLRLYRHARRQGWSIIIERKDVVHKVN